ncbi:MFS transporter [Rugosimonospora africana]|uniref:MFS transporter n=1 Tax=Rugosimonospora africana TaxID=556532 RepID=A0A8J3VS36_9ACTN|nr:MFS transporter [Rugosimonospora africana]GIH16855.1 MFS transporter [Rugosimonospora africana]
MTVRRTATKAAGGTGREVLIMATLGCCFLVVMMDNTILNVALNDIQQSLHASTSQLQWTLDSYILVYASLMFSAGSLADSYGRRRVLVAGLLVFGIASAFSAMSHSADQLIFWRSAMGVGGSVVPPATLAIISDVFPDNRRGKAIGVWSAIGGLSIAFGPIAGGFLLEKFWWGSVFLVNVPMVAVCSVLILLAVPDSRAAGRDRLDFAGVLLSMGGTGLLVYGVIRGGEAAAWTSPGVAGSLIGGGVLLAALVWFERRAAAPALDVRPLRDGAFAACTGSVAVSFFALTGGMFVLVFYLQIVLAFSPLKMGLALLPVAAGSVLSSGASHGLLRRWGARPVIVLGLVLLAGSFAGLSVVTAATPRWQLEATLSLSGLGMGLVMGAATSSIMTLVPRDKAGVGAGVNNTLRQVGAALGVAVLGSVLSQRYHSGLGTAVDALPDDLRARAANSLGGTTTSLTEAAHRPGGLASGGAALADRAQHAYLSAMHLTVLVAVAALTVTGLLVVRWLPGRATPPVSVSTRQDDHAEQEEPVLP